jgi:hypothetical protein
MSDDLNKPVAGRSLCGDIGYEYRGAPVKILHCRSALPMDYYTAPRAAA